MANPKVSIAIPYYQTDKSTAFLARLLDSISRQTFKDYEIVITSEPGMAHNHNAAILKSKGEIIKMMQVDDYFAHADALKDIVDNFNTQWMIVPCVHTEDGKEVFNAHFPRVEKDMWRGNNGLGGISTLVMRNDTKMLFDESMSWIVDCDLYQRYYDKYGLPQTLERVNVVIDIGKDRLTSVLTDDFKTKESQWYMEKYLEQKYNQMLNMSSDIQYNLPILKYFAQQVNHATEFGVRSMISSWALLAGLKEKSGTLRLIDRDHPSIYGQNMEEISKQSKKEGVDLKFIEGDTLEIEIEPTDFLFIDTIHTKEQLSKELELHAVKVSKFIGFHDTESCPELKDVINDFLDKNKHWSKVFEGKLSNGLIVIKKDE